MRATLHDLANELTIGYGTLFRGQNACRRGDLDGANKFFGDLKGTLERMQKLIASVNNGKGLGLTIVSKSLRDLGGQMDVKPTPGEGTTITCRFSSCLFPDHGSFEMNEVVELVLRSMFDHLAGDGIVLELANSPQPLFVRGDGLLMQRIVQNLVLNARAAIKAAERGHGLGKITVTLQRDTGCVVEVTDNGTGQWSTIDALAGGAAAVPAGAAAA